MLVKHKREFYKKFPYLFFSLLLLFFLAVLVFYFSKTIISKHIFFISPLAQGKISKEQSLEELLYKNNIQFTKVEVATDSSHIIFLKDQGMVYFDSGKSWQSQISSLQLILSRLTIEGKKFKKLDLRFDKPIIEF